MTLGLGAEIAARVTESASTRSRRRSCGWVATTPPTRRRLEEEYLPDLDRVLDAVDRSLAF